MKRLCVYAIGSYYGLLKKNNINQKIKHTSYHRCDVYVICVYVIEILFIYSNFTSIL